MVLSYKEFSDIVPTETLEYVDRVLTVLGYVMKNDERVYVEGCGYVSIKDSMLMLIELDTMYKSQDRYASFLSSIGYESTRLDINTKDYSPSSKTRKNLFEENSRFFCIFDRYESYASLVPSQIVASLVKTNQNSYDYNSNTPYVLGGYNNYRSFCDALSNFATKERNEKNASIAETFYGKSSIAVIDYLDTMAKIYRKLSVNRNSLNNEYRSDQDLLALSGLLALYFGNDIKENESDAIGQKEAIKKILASHNISLDNIFKTINYRFSSSELGNITAEPAVLQTYFSGFVDVKDKSVLSVPMLFEQILNRDKTHSLAIEKIFLNYNCYTGMFSDLTTKIKQKIEEENNNRFLKSVNDFYGNLPQETRLFVDYTAKIYMLLLNKMLEHKHNASILTNEDDADTLALFIAAYHVNSDISKFFIGHGITLEKVLSLLKIEISEQEINNIKLDEKILVERYRRFVYEGVNRNRRPCEITINDVIYNLCNRDFNRSMIMETIFSTLNHEVHLNSDFTEQLKQYLTSQENKRRIALTQKFFNNLPAETIEYLENTSRIHQGLLEINKDWPSKNLQVYALLLSLYDTNSDVEDFFTSLGLTNGVIFKNLNISRLNYNSKSVDIETLINFYGEFIFGGYNKDLDRKEITIKAIAHNIFNANINNTVDIIRLLGMIHKSYIDFEHFDELFEQYTIQHAEEQRKKEKEYALRYYSRQALEYMTDVTRIHSRINSFLEKHSSPLISKQADIEELSLMLGVFTRQNSSRPFFEKNGIKLTTILEKCDLPLNFLDNLSSTPDDTQIFLTSYKKYLQATCYDSPISSIVKNVFDSKINDSFLIETLTASLGSVYDILKEEVVTEKEHVVNLTIPERITLLDSEPMQTLDTSDLKSILQFGNNLTVHSQYIYDELPRLALSDTHSKAIATIDDLVDQIYVKEEVETKGTVKGFMGWLRKTFGAEKQVETHISLDNSALSRLKETIDSNIESLSRELLAYDYIRQYIEVYRRKTRYHYLIASEALQKLEEERQKLSIDSEDDYAKILQLSTFLQVMSDKVNRFSTTNQLMKQELFKVNQLIVNHFITINALQMARSDLLPLIGSELAINLGHESEASALSISNNIIGLFHNLLERNVEGTIHSIELIKNSTIPSDMVAKLSKDINLYLESLNGQEQISGRIEDFDIDEVKPIDTSYKPTLTLEPSKSDDDFHPKVYKK